MCSTWILFSLHLQWMDWNENRWRRSLFSKSYQHSPSSSQIPEVWPKTTQPAVQPPSPKVQRTPASIGSRITLKKTQRDKSLMLILPGEITNWNRIEVNFLNFDPVNRVKKQEQVREPTRLATGQRISSKTKSEKPLAKTGRRWCSKWTNNFEFPRDFLALSPLSILIVWCAFMPYLRGRKVPWNH